MKFEMPRRWYGIEADCEAPSKQNWATQLESNGFATFVRDDTYLDWSLAICERRRWLLGDGWDKS